MQYTRQHLHIVSKRLTSSLLAGIPAVTYLFFAFGSWCRKTQVALSSLCEVVPGAFVETNSTAFYAHEVIWGANGEQWRNCSVLANMAPLDNIETVNDMLLNQVQQPALALHCPHLLKTWVAVFVDGTVLVSIAFLPSRSHCLFRFLVDCVDD